MIHQQHRAPGKLRELIALLSGPHIDHFLTECMGGRSDCCDCCAALEHVKAALEEFEPV